MILENRGRPEAEMLRADLAQARDRLGGRAAELEQRARQKLAPYLEGRVPPQP